jgi:hypothetical protein
MVAALVHMMAIFGTIDAGAADLPAKSPTRDQALFLTNARPRAERPTSTMRHLFPG